MSNTFKSFTQNNKKKGPRKKPQPPETPFLLKGIDFGHTKGAYAILEGKIGAVNNTYLLDYTRLQKEARTWAAQGQSRLSKEAERRANCILVGNISDYTKQTHSERLFMKTNKF